MALLKQFTRLLCSKKWLFTLLIGLFITLANQLPVDAMKILFQSSRDFAGFEFNIYVMNADGSDRVNLTQNQNGHDVGVSW